MRIRVVFLTVAAMLLLTNPSFAAEGLDITLTDDSVIRDGDNYDDVFVYGDDTVVNVTGGTIGKLWSRDSSTIHISGGRITYAQSHDRSTINVTGGIVTKPSILDTGGTINISGGTCWNVDVGAGVLNISGGRITGMGISVPAPGGVVNVHGHGFEYYPFPGRSDGRLKGYWRDDTAFSIDFLRDAYQAVVLHEILTGSAPVADAGKDRTIIAPTPMAVQVTLDGSASIDADGDPLAYEWTWTLNGGTFKAYGPEPTIMLPVGKHTFELVVSDGIADSKADHVVITVQTLDQRINAIRAEKLQLIDAIDGVLETERQVATVLGGLLASGNLGNLPRDDVVAAREAILSSIQHHEQAQKSLQASIENLDDAILLTASTAETTEPKVPDKK